MICRWGGGCNEPGGHGLTLRFCPQHAADLAKLRAQFNGGRDVVADALVIAYAVVGAGRSLTRAELMPPTAHLTTHQRAKAFEIAQGQNWITKNNAPGSELPPGLSIQLQALVLAQDLHDGNGPPSEIDAAALAHAVERDWLTTHLEPGPVTPSLPVPWSLSKRGRKPTHQRPPTAQTTPRTPRRPTGELRRERAAKIVEIVTKANGRVSRRELAETLGVTPTTAAEAAALAIADGRLVSRSGNPKTAGYYLPHAA